MSSRRIAAIALIVVFSIVLPIGVVCWSVHSALLGKPVGRPSNERKIYDGVVKNGELWFPVMKYLGKTDSLPVSWRIKRLDLETGIERETGLEALNDRCWPIALNGEIYGQGSNAIYRMVDSAVKKIGPGYQITATFAAGVFAYDGQLATIVETDDGGFRLRHLIDGQWVDDRRVLLPKLGTKWLGDEQDGIRLKLPEPQQPVPIGNRLSLAVIQDRQRLHLFLTDDNSFAAYRNGFEFVDEDHGEVSALEPANAMRGRSIPDVSGWEPIQPMEPGDNWMSAACDGDGILFSSWRTPGRVVRRSADGKWTNVNGLDHLDTGWNRLIITDLSESTGYIVDECQVWNTAVFCRINGGAVQPPFLNLPGCIPEYFGRWKRLFVELFLAWVLHLGILVGGTVWLTRAVVDSNYSLGVQLATLASSRRRVLAFSVDVSLILITVFLLAYLQWDFFGIELKPATPIAIGDSLVEYEQVVRVGMRAGFGRLLDLLKNAVQSSLALFVDSYSGSLVYLTMAGAEVLVLFGLKSYFESHFGITPGKWLFGIRTVRTSLRPCGFARALARNVMYWVDIPFFVTPIPAAISMMLSPHRQRLGDRVADTLVVNADSIRMTSEER